MQLETQQNLESPPPPPVPTAAAGWEKWHGVNARGMQAVTHWICETTRLGPGGTALDVACGTGLPSLALAARVGATGRVVATDASPEMLAAARRIASAAGLDQLDHRVMSADTLDVPDASFDAVTCCFGLMFCPDPTAAVREMRRTLKPGGRFAFTVWDEAARCPFFGVTFQSLAQVVPPAPPAPGSRGMFGLAPAAELERIVRAGGFQDVTIQTLDVAFEFSSPDEHWEMFLDMAAPVRAAVSQLPPSEVARLRRLIEDASSDYRTGDALRLPASVLAATGSR